MLRLRYFLLACSFALATAGTARAQNQDVSTETIVINSGDDRDLSWSTLERFQIGPAIDGPAAFFRVFPWTIATDSDGLIYILDTGDHVVRIFDEEGRFLRKLGGKGGGPSEFMRPVGLAVRSNGTLVIADVGKASLVQLDGSGNPLEQIHLNEKLGPIGSVGDALLIAMEWSRSVYRLDLIRGDGSTTTLADVGEPRMIRYPSCRMGIPGRPFFSQAVIWAADGEYIAHNSMPEYEISVLSGSRHVRVIRRSIEPIRIGRRDALRSDQVRRGYRISWPGNRCEIPPEELLETRGYADQISPIVDLSIRPNGQLWVKRRFEFGGDSRIDVFDPSGQYQGTLPEAFPFPIAWQSMSQFLTFGVSEVGIPYVVAIELKETSRK